MRSQLRVAIYDHTNHINSMAPMQYLEAYAKQKGFYPLIFADISNGVGQRPALEDLINLVRKRKVDITITHSLSRFSRKNLEVVAIMNELEKYNMKVVIQNGWIEVAHHE